MGLAYAQEKNTSLTSLGQHPLHQHPLPSDFLLNSPGGQFRYRIIGPCCRLFDREQLPWPCCRIQWRSKEPSWRRIGNRLVADMAVKRYASYSVELIGYGNPPEPTILTLYMERLPPQVQDWWYTRNRLSIPKAPLLPSPDAFTSMQITLNLVK